MEKVTGRSDDMMIVRGVNVFPSQIEEQIFKLPQLAAHYQIVLTRDNRLDDMEVLVEAAPNAAGGEERVASAAKLAVLIKDNIGSSARVTVTEPGGVERSQGKARRVIDKRPKE